MVAGARPRGRGRVDTLGARLAEALREVAIMVPSSPVPGLFALRWDFLELKERARRAGLAPEAEADWADAVLEGEGFLLGGGAPPDYRRALVRAAEALAADPRPQTVDRVLDAEMFRAVFRRLDERPVPAARAYFSRRADLLNVGVVLRGKRRRMDWGVVREWLVEGGSLRESVFFEAFGASTDSFAAAFAGTVLERLLGKRALADGEGEAGRRLERLGDDHLTDFLRLARYVSFGPEPLVGYLHGVEVEVKNVRRVLTGLALGEDAGGIRAGLRRAYV
ncbi:MAG: V-type ATPase subunit [Nitrospinota bacterium]